MDTVRYAMGVLLVVVLPPAILYWWAAHPLASFWRRLGARVTIGTLLVGYALVVWGLWRVKDSILGTDLGTRYALMPPAVLLYATSIVLEMNIRKHLKLKTLVGVPEFSAGPDRGRVLSEGIYAHVRHPRYVSVAIGTLGWALFINYVGAYLIVLAAIPGLYVVAVLEERELLRRFGDEYARYRERVPRFLPRLGRGRASVS